MNSSTDSVSTGKSNRWGSDRRTEILPFSNIIRPKLGVGGWMPIPRKLSNISEPATPASPADTITITGPMTLGNTCFIRIRRVGAPMARAASTYWFSLAWRTWPRTSLAMPNQENMARARDRTM